MGKSIFPEECFLIKSINVFKYDICRSAVVAKANIQGCADFLPGSMGTQGKQMLLTLEIFLAARANEAHKDHQNNLSSEKCKYNYQNCTWRNPNCLLNNKI